jgi:signal transduction histidine kinase
VESANQIAVLKESEHTIRLQEERLRKVEKLAAAGQLAASLAHEINNPLASVTNALYILQNFSDLPAETTALVNTAAGELARVSRIVKQSLSYYRVDRAPKEIDLAQIIQESLRIFEEKFRKAGLQIRTRIRPQTTILGFGDEIRQAIDNLLLNAVEATPRGGRLVVSLRLSRDRKDQRQPGIARLTIADTGSGISRDQLSRLFEPFFTTKAEKGNGLGLWVVRGIVTKHEGSIRIRSSTRERNRGTVVSTLWPVQQKGSATLEPVGEASYSA